MRVSKLKLYYSENLLSPIFAFASENSPECGKEGNYSSLWQREVRRDFIINVAFILRPLINAEYSKTCQ
jgi:hypothetical protein